MLFRDFLSFQPTFALPAVRRFEPFLVEPLRRMVGSAVMDAFFFIHFFKFSLIMLKVGDEIIRCSNYGVIDCIAIDKVTPKQAFLTLKDGVFQKRIKLKREPNADGIITEISPDKFNGFRYRLPKDGDIEVAKFKIAIRICSKCDFDSLDKEKVIKIAELISF